MNCDEARRHWSLYHDSEGEPEMYFQVNEHLAGCPACAEWFHQQSRLEELLCQKLAQPEPSTPLWSRVLAGSGLRRRSTLRRWIAFGGLAVLAASIVLAVAIWRPRPDRPALEPENGHDLARLTAAYHDELVAGRRAVQIVSENDLEVERDLRRLVSFPVRCPPRKDSGFHVQGAGVSPLGEAQAAYLVGRVEGRPVSIFILPRESLAKFPHQHAAVRREGTHRCREGENEMVMAEIDRNVVLVVGRVESGRLLRVLKAYGTYPHGKVRKHVDS